MSTQTGFLDTPAEPETEPRVRRDKSVITRRDLVHSIIACHRVEDEIWRRLREADCTEQTPAARIHAALAFECADAPAWCERDAWQRMVRAFREWSGIFGTLQLYATLRQKRDK